MFEKLIALDIEGLISTELLGMPPCCLTIILLYILQLNARQNTEINTEKGIIVTAETHSNVSNCPFCMWLQGDGATPPVVFEDADLIATLCESPISKGHTQIIFKKHYHELSEVDSGDAAKLGALIPTISKAIKNGLGAEMVYVACIAEEVRHVHFHLVPRYPAETKGFTHFTGTRIRLENVDVTLASIKKNLAVPAP